MVIRISDKKNYLPASVIRVFFVVGFFFVCFFKVRFTISIHLHMTEKVKGWTNIQPMELD